MEVPANIGIFRRINVKKIIAAVIVLSSLAGCVAYPAPYYGRAYYGPPPAAVVVAPRPYYWGRY